MFRTDLIALTVSTSGSCFLRGNLSITILFLHTNRTPINTIFEMATNKMVYHSIYSQFWYSWISAWSTLSSAEFELFAYSFTSMSSVFTVSRCSMTTNWPIKAVQMRNYATGYTSLKKRATTNKPCVQQTVYRSRFIRFGSLSNTGSSKNLSTGYAVMQ